MRKNIFLRKKKTYYITKTEHKKFLHAQRKVMLALDKKDILALQAALSDPFAAENRNNYCEEVICHSKLKLSFLKLYLDPQEYKELEAFYKKFFSMVDVLKSETERKILNAELDLQEDAKEILPEPEPAPKKRRM